MPSVRLTVLPLASVATNVASRDAFTFWAILFRTKSQETLFQLLAPGARYCGDSTRRGRQLHRRRALRAEPALVDRAVRVALDLQQLHGAIGVLAGIRDQRAADCAVRADRMRFLGPRDAEVLLDLGRFGDSDVESKSRCREGRGTGNSNLQKIPACDGRYRSQAS